MLPKGRAGPVDGVARFCGWRPKKGALSGCEIVKWTHEGLGVSDVGAMDCPPDVKHGFGHLQCGHNCTESQMCVTFAQAREPSRVLGAAREPRPRVRGSGPWGPQGPSGCQRGLGTWGHRDDRTTWRSSLVPLSLMVFQGGP